MNHDHPTQTSVSDDLWLDEFLERYDAAEDRAATLAQYCAARPDAAERFRGLAEVSDRLRSAAIGAPCDERLGAVYVLGPFCVVREIATGGMGVIYEARQIGLERRVAIKTIRADRASHAARKRFVREQQALAILHHTHIVPIFASGVQGELQYYGMQLIQGVTLHRLIHRLRGGAITTWRGADELLKVLPADGAACEAGASPLVETDLNQKCVPADVPASYFRFAAETVAQAAAALQSAHDRQVIHRDIKPANLMIDENGKCWLIDFGLARLPAGNAAPEDGALDAECAAMTQHALGTQPYMSPEHFLLQADERSDVWSLGVVLYELLTLRRAFPGQTTRQARQLIEANAPTPPNQLVRNVPAALAAIFSKATYSKPHDRYASARELGQDLQRWLAHEPTAALPVRLPERLWLWALRNPGRALASALAAAMASAAALAMMLALSTNARLHATRADAATQRALLAERGERSQRREILMRDLVQLRLNTRADGWTQQADKLVSQIVPMGADEELRKQAASCLMGLDAVWKTGFSDAPGWSVAISPDERWVLSGGPQPGIPTRLIEVNTGQTTDSSLEGPSLITFLTDGTPVQVALPTADRPRFLFWNAREQNSLAELPAPSGWVTDGLISAFSRDGTRLALGGRRGKEPVLLVIDVALGKLACEHPAEASAIALADEGQLLALGQATGMVSVFQVADLKLIAEFAAERGAITALDLCRSPFIPRTGSHPSRRWYLAVAATGGSLAVWNLESGTLVNQFRGSSHGLHAVSLSQDGTTLASCGRNDPRLWDVATGKLLMEIHGRQGRDWHRGIQLSQNASLLAASQSGTDTVAGGCQVWRLQNGRGVLSLRGLSSPVAQVWFSSDDSLIAALSHTWELGVWDSASGRLLNVFESPIGGYTDNAGLAFSPDNRRLAFATSGEACVWNLSVPEIVDRWELCPGFCENLAFTPSGDLVLFRWELDQGSADIDSARTYPARGYVLTPGGRVTETVEYHPRLGRANDFDMSASGEVVLIDGRSGAEPTNRAVSAFDRSTGRLRWTLAAPYPTDAGHLLMNRSGALAFVHMTSEEQSAIIDMNSGALIRRGSRDVGAYCATALSNSGDYTFGTHRLGLVDWTLFKTQGTHGMPSQPVFTIALPEAATGMQRAEFSTNDQRVAWGTGGGEVLVADIPQVVQTMRARQLTDH